MARQVQQQFHAYTEQKFNSRVLADCAREVKPLLHRNNICETKNNFDVEPLNAIK